MISADDYFWQAKKLAVMNGLKVLMLLMMIMRNLLLVPNGKIERFVCANFFDIKKVENGRTP